MTSFDTLPLDVNCGHLLTGSNLSDRPRRGGGGGDGDNDGNNERDNGGGENEDSSRGEASPNGSPSSPLTLSLPGTGGHANVQSGHGRLSHQDGAAVTALSYSSRRNLLVPSSRPTDQLSSFRWPLGCRKIQYLCTLVRGEALRQFDMLSADFESSTPLTLEAIFWYWVRIFSC